MLCGRALAKDRLLIFLVKKAKFFCPTRPPTRPLFFLREPLQKFHKTTVPQDHCLRTFQTLLSTSIFLRSAATLSVTLYHSVKHYTFSIFITTNSVRMLCNLHYINVLLCFTNYLICQLNIIITISIAICICYLLLISTFDTKLCCFYQYP